MQKTFTRTRQAFAVLATLSFLAVSTAAVAHSHPAGQSDDDSHCPMCMVAHNATHALAVPVIALNFTARQTAFLVHPETLFAVFVLRFLSQDRAPPRF